MNFCLFIWCFLHGFDPMVKKNINWAVLSDEQMSNE